jgi:hypothetical protein
LLEKVREELLLEPMLDDPLETNVSRLENPGTISRYKNEDDMGVFIKDEGPELHSGMDRINVEVENKFLIVCEGGIVLDDG